MRALIGVELLRKLPAGPVDIRDTKLPGFVLRVRPSGTHSNFANYARGKWQALGTTAVLTAPEAREQARQALADVAKGADPAAKRKAERSRLQFDTFISEHYEPWATAQRKTGAEQTARLRASFGLMLRGLRLDEITAFHVERWRSARLRAGITAATVNRDLNVLRGALSRAIDWGLLASHPLARVKASKTDRSAAVRYLTPDEETRLLAALTARDDKRRAQRTRANRWRRDRGYRRWPEYGTYTDHVTPLVILALHTGLRRGELFQLRWSDVDLGAARRAGATRDCGVPADGAAADGVTRLARDWRPRDRHALGGESHHCDRCRTGSRTWTTAATCAWGNQTSRWTTRRRRHRQPRPS